MGKPIGELLVEARALSRENLEEVLKLPRPAGKKLGQLLIEMGYVTEAQVTQSLSLQLSVPWVSLYHIDFSRNLLNMVPRALAEEHCLVPIFIRHVKGQGETMYVAIEDPNNTVALNKVSKAVGLPVRPMIASPTDIRSALRVYYKTGDDTKSAGDSAPPASVEILEAKKNDPPPLPSSKRVPAARTVGISSDSHVPAAADANADSEPPISVDVPVAASGDSPDASPEIEAGETEVVLPGGTTRMVALTLLDGTSIQLPARPRPKKDSSPPSEGGMSDQLTARDLISALRALSHGADASEVLGDKPQWEAMFAALLSILLKKGLIADWEFVEELRKI